MILVLALLGLMIGGGIANFGGALAGAALGYAIGLHLSFRRRLDALEDEIRRVARRTASTPAAPPAELRWTPQSETPAVSPVAAGTAIPATAPATAAKAAVAPAPAAQILKDAPMRAPLEPAVLDSSFRRGSQPRPPEEPRLIAWIRDYFSGGNLVVRSGIVVLFFGVAFLLKFAADRDMLPIELRLAGVALGGAILLGIGWRLRHRQRAYGLALQGGGVGLHYLTAFAALRLYGLLPPTVAFALLVAVAALSAFLAIGQNSLALAALGASGGFLAPVLASTGEGNHVVLFSFYALLNAGVVAIAWFKAWRPLNLLAFAFTYGIGTVWGVLRYSPENFATTEPFVFLFFAMFVAVAVLFALRRAPDLRDYVDGTLVFGTPVMTMLLQSALVRDVPYAMAFSALSFGAVYLALAALAWRLRREQLRLLASAFLALGVAFLTLAVPLALDGHWTAATWALEGAAILWIGLRQGRGLAIASGVLLQVGAAVSYFARHDVHGLEWPLANSQFLGALLIAIAGGASAQVLRTTSLAPDWRWARVPPVYWALVWWFVAGVGEIDRWLPVDARVSQVLAFSTLTALGCAALARWHDWREWQWPQLLLLPAMILCGFASLQQGHFLWNGGWLAWPAALIAWAWLLRRRAEGDPRVDPWLHVASLWLVVALVSVELHWQVKTLRLAAIGWRHAIVALPATAALWLLRAKWRAWPVRAWPNAWLGVGAAGLALFLWAWTLLMCGDDAAAAPLPYLPLVNPIELAQWLALGGIAGWLVHLHRHVSSNVEVLHAWWWALAAASFMVLTTMLLRTIHHAVGVDFNPRALASSTVVQAALSIFWGLLALAAMVAGARRGLRIVWLAGAALLAVVLAKMFLVDLSRTATVARIVSFIGVGVLMLVIGRFSPVPPARRPAEAV